MTVKVLKDRTSRPYLIVPKGIKVKHASSFEDEMFFVLAEAPIEKSEGEIQFEKEMNILYKKLYHNSTNPFVRRQRDIKAIEEVRWQYEHALVGLELEKQKRLQDSTYLYLGGYGDLDSAKIYDHPIEMKGFCYVQYGLGEIKGKLFASIQPKNKHNDFAIHNRKRLNLTRLI